VQGHFPQPAIGIFITIYCHSPDGDTAVALADRAFYTTYAHSPQGHNAMALVEFALSECSCYIMYRFKRRYCTSSTSCSYMHMCPRRSLTILCVLLPHGKYVNMVSMWQHPECNKTCHFEILTWKIGGGASLYPNLWGWTPLPNTTPPTWFTNPPSPANRRVSGSRSAYGKKLADSLFKRCNQVCADK